MKLLKMEEVYFAYDTEWNLKDISFLFMIMKDVSY